MFVVIVAIEQLSCGQIKYNPVITEFDHCVAFSDTIDFEERVFNVYNISGASMQVSRFTRKEYAVVFAFHNSAISNLVVNVDCQFHIEGHAVIVLDLGSNTFVNVRVFGQCVKAQKFSYMLQTLIMSAGRSIWSNVTTGASASSNGLANFQFAFRGTELPFFYNDSHSLADTILDANEIMHHYTRQRFYENETFNSEIAFIFADRHVYACAFPYQATNGICLESNYTFLEPRLTEFFEQSYYLEENEFFVFRTQNQSLYRCKDNYVFYYGICMPQCPHGMVNQSGYCVWFCDPNFVIFCGVCLAECPFWLEEDGNTCIEDENDVKNLLFCSQYDGFPKMQSLHEADDFLEMNSVFERCRLYIYRHVVLSWDIGRVCEQPFVWVYGNCRLECPDGMYRHVESNTCREERLCTVIFEQLCLDLCPPGFVEEGNWTCGQYTDSKLTSAYLFRDDETPNMIVVNDSYAMNKCSRKRENSLCVNECSVGFYFLAEENSCVENCPDYADIMTMTCVSECDSEQYRYTRRCYDECPLGTFYNSISLTCEDSCKPLLEQNTSCVSQCLPSFYNSSYICVRECPTTLFSNNVSRKCVESCELDEIVVEGRFCISDNDYYTKIFDEHQHMCAEGFYDEIYSEECVFECPPGLMSYMHFCTNRCFSYFKINSLCVEHCPSPLIADLLTMSCVTECEPYRFFDKERNICAMECPDDGFVTSDGLCHQRCPDDLFGDSRTRKCVLKCDVYGDPDLHLCVHKCEPPLYGNNISGICEPHCPIDAYSDQLSRVCVRRCPDGFMTDNINRNCTATCPRSLLQEGRECVRWCRDSYADYQNFVCVKSCRGIVFGGSCFERRFTITITRESIPQSEIWNMVIAVGMAALLLIVCVV